MDKRSYAASRLRLKELGIAELLDGKRATFEVMLAEIDMKILFFFRPSTHPRASSLQAFSAS
jgi:hypothetical protein